MRVAGPNRSRRAHAPRLFAWRLCTSLVCASVAGGLAFAGSGAAQTPAPSARLTVRPHTMASGTLNPAAGRIRSTRFPPLS